MVKEETSSAGMGQTRAPMGKNLSSDFPKYLITGLGIAAIIIYRYYKIEFQWTEIVLFALAVSPWLTSFFEIFKFGKDGLEFVSRKIEEAKLDIKKEVKNEASKLADETADKLEAVQQSNEITRTLVTTGAGGKTQSEAFERLEEIKKTAKNPEDPQKEQWGGKNEANGRRMTARIEKLKGEDYLRRVIFIVESTDKSQNPLTDTVTFYLHPTFRRPVIDVKPRNGAAELSLIAYGAFTAGVVTDGGATRLEFDLTCIDDGKDPFFKR